MKALRTGFEDHTVCSDAFRKSCILPDSSTTSQICVLTRSDGIRRVLSIELSRFYHGVPTPDDPILQSAKNESNAPSLMPCLFLLRWTREKELNFTSSETAKVGTPEDPTLLEVRQ